MNALTPVYSRQGCELRLLGYAAGSDNDSVWARRFTDNALRCYYLYDVRLPEGVASISAILPTLAPLTKQEAEKA